MKILFLLITFILPMTLFSRESAYVTLISSDVADFDSSVYSFTERKVGGFNSQLRFNATFGTVGYFDMEYPREEGFIVDLGQRGCFDFFKVAPLVTYIQKGNASQWIEDILREYNIPNQNQRFSMINEGHCYFLHSKRLKNSNQSYSEIMGIFYVKKFSERYGVTLTNVNSFN